MLIQKVCTCNHDKLCEKTPLEYEWYQHKLENENMIIMRDFTAETDHIICHCQPGLIDAKTDTQECLFVDVAVPDYHQLMRKKTKKIINYADIKVAHGVMVIVAGNGHSDISSNPGQE